MFSRGSTLQLSGGTTSRVARTAGKRVVLAASHFFALRAGRTVIPVAGVAVISAAVCEVVMDFSKRQEEKIKQMITSGAQIKKIAAEIGGGCTWYDVQEFCWESGHMSWQGSKKMISSRLKRFKTASRQSDRQKLAKEIDQSVSYLYYCAKAMRERIVAVEKALSHIK